MAGPYYWVGGTGNTSDATNHWSTSSGGAPNAANVPTSADDVNFDGASNGSGYTVTVDATFTCRNFTVAAPASGNVTLAGSAAFDCYGDFTLYSGMVRTYTGAITFKSTATGKTITCAGIGLASTTRWEGAGGGWTLQDAWSSPTTSHTVANGTLDTNGKTVTTGAFFLSGGTLTLGATTLNCNGWTKSGGTLNAGTSTIASSSATFAGGGATYNIVTDVGNNITVTGANTFATWTLTPGAIKTATLTLSANQTVTGTFTATGNSSVNRLLVRSNTRGTAQTISAGTVSTSNSDWQDITGAGAGSWDLSAIAGLSGDCGGNSGITFTTAAPQYWQHGASASYNWSDSTRWFLATNGGGGAGRVPLPQDTAYFDANSFAASGKTVVQDMPRIGTVDWTGVTNTPTWTTSTAASVFGAITLASGLTLTASSQAYTFEGRSSFTLTCAGKSWSKQMVFDCVNGTYTCQDAFANTGSSGTYLLSGTLDANGFNFTSTVFVTSGTGTKFLSMGAGTWTVTAGSGDIWNLSTVTGLTVNASTSKISMTGALSGSPRFQGGGKTYYNLELATTNAIALGIVGSNTFNNIHIDASAAARTVNFTAGTTTTIASMTRDAGTNVITIGSITAAAHTLTKSGGGTITMENMSISQSTATPGSTWYANFSTDGGSNSGWTFTRTHQATVPSLSGSVTLNVLAGLNLEASVTLPGPVTLAFSPTMTLAASPTISGSVTLFPNGGLIHGATISISASALLAFDWSALPTGRFSASLKSALASGRALAIWLLEMEIAGTTHRIGFAPYSSRSGNHYSAGLLSLTLGVEARSDREGRMSPWETRGEFEDVDRTVAGLLSGANGDDVVGGAARVWLAHPDVLPANWFKAREGLVARLAPMGALRYAVDIRPNDSPLRREPLPSWTITKSTWPNAHDSAIGKIPVAAYGTHDGANLGVTRGLLPAYFVDTAANAFVLSRGWSKTVTRVCGDDATITGGDYTISRPLIKGRRYTICTFTNATHNAATITWDGEGVEDVGNGSGTLIESPLEQLAHALSQYYFGNYQTGTWLPTAAEIDATCLSDASAFLDARGITGSLAITEKESGEELIARVLTSNEARAAWANDGTICFGTDETDADPYDGEVVDWRSDDLGEMVIAEQDIAVVARVTVEHAIDKATGSPLSTFEIQLPGNDGLEAETLTLTTSATE